MNLDIIKKEISERIGDRVKITVNGMRNKTNVYVGIIDTLYPNIFTVLVDNENKSFSYADIVTGEVVVEYC